MAGVFITLIGPDTYKLLRSLVHATKPDDMTYQEVTEVLTAHFKPTPSEIVQWFRFHTRFCKPGETVAVFVSELRSLAEYCNYGASLENTG